MRKPLILLFLLFYCAKGFSATFLVTSNADSGPGTLRDALLQAAANGTTEKDYINFNLSGNSIADKTITLQNQLPNVTDNIVIDGTTQPGAALGVSNAKVIITIANPIYNVNAFNISSQYSFYTIEIYGFYIEGFTQGQESAINVNSDCNLIVGAPGKGNVLCNNWCGVYGDLDSAVIQSNFLGIAPDGFTPQPNLAAAIAGTYQFNDLLIGGDSQADGNVILEGSSNAINFGTGTGGTKLETVTIKNNYFGTNYLGTAPAGTGYGGFINVNDADIINITNNVFSAYSIAVNAYNSASLVIKGNYFGTDKTQTHALGQGGEAIEQNSFVNATIGGVADTDQNVFTGYGNPFLSINYSTTNVIKNKFYCNQQVILPDYFNDNYIRIIKLTGTEAAGDAPPGATVQLYYSTEQCASCNPNTWFATITADASGKWDYTGTILQSVMASSTVGGNTVGFQPYAIGQNEVNITNYDCHHQGSIALIEMRVGIFQFQWTDSNGKILGTGQAIGNLSPGTYYLQMTENGGCPTATGQFTITDLTTHIQGGGSNRLECGDSTTTYTPFITTAQGITVTNYYWLDSNGNVISTVLTPQLPVGIYTFYVKDSNGCTTAPVTVQILPQYPPPVLDGSKAIVTDADCNQNDGSITNVTIQNIPIGGYAGWFTSAGNFVSYGPDLTNAAPGTYYYSITYDYNCSPLVTQKYTIGVKNGITMDETNAKTTPSSCGVGSGSVTGIQVTGATQYQWTDAGNNVISTNINLTGVPAGTYTLTATNTTGCSKTSQAYTVNALPPTVYPVYPYISNNTCPNSATGSIKITTDTLVASYRWINSAGKNIGIGVEIDNLAAGTYTLYLTDKNGCETLYNSYKINNIIPVTITTGTGDVTADQCNLKTGSITGIQVSGGISPYAYNWTDNNANTVSTSINLDSVGAGTYTLTVTDASGCGPASNSYALQNIDSTVPTPSVSNVQICSSGSVLLSVNNPSATAVYNLYDSESSTQPLEQVTGGKFRVSVTANTSYFITQVSGTCESSKAQINISVGLSSLNIANTFTPNGDGVNDYWQINNIDNYPQALVQIFTRYGQKVFESKGYSIPFDGTYKGQKLPAGVYYYIINLSTNCSLISGSLTIIR